MADTPFQMPTRQRLEVEKFDEIVRSVSAVDSNHRMVHEGFMHYAINFELAVPDGVTRYTLLRTGTKPVHLKGFTVRASEGPININLYEDTPLATIPSPIGTPLPTFNMNRLSGRVAETLMWQDVQVQGSPLQLGTLFLGNLFIPGDGNEKGVIGQSTFEELILLPNTDYLFTLNNDPAGAGAADISAAIAFYETDFPAP